MPIALDGIRTCISGIRAHSASDCTTTAGTPRVSRMKHFRHSPVSSIAKQCVTERERERGGGGGERKGEREREGETEVRVRETEGEREEGKKGENVYEREKGNGGEKMGVGLLVFGASFQF